MSPLTIALVLIGLASNIVCFCFGVILGRQTAYKMLQTYQHADTAVDMRCAKSNCSKGARKSPEG